MSAANPSPSLLQAANRAQDAARAARQSNMALAFQVITAVNLAVLTGVAAYRLYRDIKRSEHDKVRGR